MALTPRLAPDFLAGTCKYGTSCALAHVSPVGTLVKTKAVRNIRNANIRERAEMRDRDPMMGNSVDDFGDVLLSSADPIVVGSPIRRGSHLAVSPPTDSILAQAAANGLRPSLARSDPMDFREPRRRVDSLIEDDDDDNHGSPVNLLPSSLSDLLTPMEQMQLSRSQEDTYLRSRGNGLGLENAGPISLLPSSSRRLPGVSSARLSQSYAPGRIVDDPLKLYGRSIPEDIVSSPSTRLPYSTSDRSRSESLFSMGAENLLSGPSSRSLLSGAFDGTGFLSAANAGSAQSPAPSLARGLSPSEGNGGSTWNPMADEIDVFHMDSIDEDAVAGEDLEMKIQQSLPPISGSASGAPSPRTVSNQTVLSFSAAAKKAIVTDPIAPERPSPAMQEAAKITKSVAPDPRRNTPLCPFAVTGSCKIGAERCRYVHGLVCPSCNRAVLHPADSAAEHQAHVFECQKAMAASEDSKAQMDQGKDMECGICFEKVMSKKDPRFGLLLCPHAFCIEVGF